MLIGLIWLLLALPLSRYLALPLLLSRSPTLLLSLFCFRSPALALLLYRSLRPSLSSSISLPLPSFLPPDIPPSNFLFFPYSVFVR